MFSLLFLDETTSSNFVNILNQPGDRGTGQRDKKYKLEFNFLARAILFLLTWCKPYWEKSKEGGKKEWKKEREKKRLIVATSFFLQCPMAMPNYFTIHFGYFGTLYGTLYSEMEHAACNEYGHFSIILGTYTKSS
jgi:hypothetical protein